MQFSFYCVLSWKMSYQPWLPDHLNLGVKSTASQVKLCIPDVDVSPWQLICSFSLQAGTQGWGNKTSEQIFLRTAELLFTDVLWAFWSQAVKILSCRKQKARIFSMLLVLLLFSSFLFGNIDWRKETPKLMVWFGFRIKTTMRHYGHGLCL